MDFSKLKTALDAGILTDLKLILVDDHDNEVIMNVHKLVLYLSCVYFEKLLTKFREKDLNEITLRVPNAPICCDIIRSFYNLEEISVNIPTWQKSFEKIICYDFWNMVHNCQFSSEMEIPEEGFELLLRVVNILGYTSDHLQLVANNLPKKYDLSKLDKVLFNKLINHQRFIIISNSDCCFKVFEIEIINGNTDFIVPEKCKQMTSITCTCVSPNKKKIIIGKSDGNILIYNIKSKELVKTFCDYGNDNKIISICMTPDSTKIISANKITAVNISISIKIWNAITGDVISKIIVGEYINVLCCTSDSKKIISGGNHIKIWNIETGELIKDLKMDDRLDHDINHLCLSFDDNKLISGICLSSNDNKLISDNETVCVWDMTTGNLLHKLQEHTRQITDVCLSADKKNIFSCSTDGTIIIWDLETGDLVKKIKGNMPINTICPLDNDRLIYGTKTRCYIYNIKTDETKSIIIGCDSYKMHCYKCIDLIVNDQDELQYISEKNFINTSIY